MDKQLVKTSKFLSLVLRHQPEVIGVTLDSEGWIDVAELLQACAQHGRSLTRDVLEDVVRNNDKQRFAFSADGSRIRANQGHSVEVDLKLAPCPPPDVLFHGTVAQFLASIRHNGLLKGTRQHVHLSPDEATAQKVGARRGRPVVLHIAAQQMFAAGHLFYQSANGVWLVETVPPEFLTFPPE